MDTEKSCGYPRLVPFRFVIPSPGKALPQRGAARWKTGIDGSLQKFHKFFLKNMQIMLAFSMTLGYDIAVSTQNERVLTTASDADPM